MIDSEIAAKLIYELKLFEKVFLKHDGYCGDYFGVIVLRVPGGWIINSRTGGDDPSQNSVFVPFNNEFQP